MTNHPNRRTVYRVSTTDGRFDHVATHKASIARVIELVDAPVNTSARELARQWGIKIVKVSAATARSVGL